LVELLAPCGWALSEVRRAGVHYGVQLRHHWIRRTGNQKKAGTSPTLFNASPVISAIGKYENL